MLKSIQADESKERALKVDGTIVKMEFLHAVGDDSDHVILLLVICKNGKSRLVWYEWNTSLTLHEAPLEPSTHALPPADRLPLMVIPLLFRTSFLLVGESRICTVKNLLTGTPEFLPNDLRVGGEAEGMPTLKRRPVWVQWARPMRAPPFVNSLDDSIYLCREDGMLAYIRINNSIPHLINDSSNAGRLGTNVTGPLAIIDVGPFTDDFLVLGGDSGVEGHWRLSPWEGAEHLFDGGTWTPINDAVAASIPKSDSYETNIHHDLYHSQRLFTCTGKISNGSVTELRFGLQVSKSFDSIDLRGATNDTVLDLWTLRPADNVTYILISHPTSSSLLLLCEGREPELLDESAGFCLDERTVLAKTCGNASMCQITQRSIRGVSLADSSNRTTSWQGDLGGSGEEILSACVEHIDGLFLALIAFRRQHTFCLRLGALGMSYVPIGEELWLTVQPTCVAMRVYDGQALILVGNAQGLETFTVLPGFRDKGLRRIGMWESRHPFEVSDSIVMLDLKGKEEWSSRPLIVCGLRNGWVNIFTFDSNQGAWSVLLYPI